MNEPPAHQYFRMLAKTSGLIAERMREIVSDAAFRQQPPDWEGLEREVTAIIAGNLEAGPVVWRCPNCGVMSSGGNRTEPTRIELRCAQCKGVVVWQPKEATDGA